MAERKVWILDTSTKGTGAQMVPLTDAREGGGDAARDQITSPAMRRSGDAGEPAAPRPPRRFRVVDVMTREVLLDDADLRTTLALLGTIRRSVDVNIHVWEPKRDAWRLLGLGEQREVWARRQAAPASGRSSSA